MAKMVTDAGRMTHDAHQAVLSLLEYIVCTLHAQAYQELAAVVRLLRGVWFICCGSLESRWWRLSVVIPPCL